MYSGDGEARRRPWVLGLIILAHLLLGFLFFSSSGPAPGPSRIFSGVSGSARGNLALRPHI